VTVPIGQYVPGLHAEQVVLPMVPYVLTEQRDTPAKVLKSNRERKENADETHKTTDAIQQRENKTTLLMMRFTHESTNTENNNVVITVMIVVPAGGVKIRMM
jgi:hypothetical protein